MTDHDATTELPEPTELSVPGLGQPRVGVSLAASTAIAAAVSLLVCAGSWLLAPTKTRPAHQGPAPATPQIATMDVSKVLSANAKAIVAIDAERVDPGRASGATGTGVIVSAQQGLIVTNAHVVAGATSITVRFDDGTRHTAEVVKKLPLDDIAVLKVANAGLTEAVLGSSASLQVGAPVMAVGYALALQGSPTVTVGIVSALGRDIDAPGIHLRGLVQTDAAINHGNSGGPLLDAKGAVVGINTLVAEGSENMGFAIGIDAVKTFLRDVGMVV